MAWTFERIERIEAIIETHERILKYLRSARYSIPRERRIPIDMRIAYTEERMREFQSLARTMRYNRRMADKVAETTT